MVPDATFGSYYGRPVLNRPVWRTPDVPAYFFLGGLAGGSSVLALGAQATRRRGLALPAKVTAAGAAVLSGVALVHDLGRPERFLNMLRVFKPTSPMSVGSWLLAAYGPLAGAAAATELTGRARATGTVTTVGAAVLGPLVAAYTGALLADTAVPAWHEGHRELPYVFVGSAAAAAAGMGLVASPVAENGPARRLAVAGAAVELVAATALERRAGRVAEPYRTGRSGTLVKAGRGLAAAGVVGAVVTSRRSRLAAAVSGALLLAASACTRWGVFEAGLASADDPGYTVEPQRERLGQPAGTRISE